MLMCPYEQLIYLEYLARYFLDGITAARDVIRRVYNLHYWIIYRASRA